MKRRTDSARIAFVIDSSPKPQVARVLQTEIVRGLIGGSLEVYKAKGPSVVGE